MGAILIGVIGRLVFPLHANLNWYGCLMGSLF